MEPGVVGGVGMGMEKIRAAALGETPKARPGLDRSRALPRDQGTARAELGVAQTRPRRFYGPRR